MAETIRIEIPVEVKDRASSQLSGITKGLRDMEHASSGARNSMSQAERAASQFDRTAQKTQRSLSQMAKEKYQAVLEVMDKISPALSKVSGSLRQIGGKAWSVTMKAVDLATAPVKGILNLLKNPVLQAGAVLGISVGFKDTVDTFANFEAGMSQVKAISGATESEFEKLTAKAKQMGATTKFTATESAEAFRYMAMAGWKSGEMMGGIEGIMNLAASSGESLGTVSDIVTDALTAFGMKAADAGHFSNVLAQASSNSNTNVSLMGETFKYAGTMAGALGYSIEDVALATGLMANVGLKGSMAGTALNSIMTRLSNNTNGAQDAIKALGVEFFNADGSARKFADVMGELRAATAEMTDEQKTTFANAVAGERAQKGLLAILNAEEADYYKLAKAIGSSDGAAKRMANTMLDNLQGAFTLLQSAADGVKLSLGERLKPYLMELASWLTAQMPAIEKGLMQFMDFVDEKVEAVKEKIGEFTASEQWKEADLFGKIHIAWDELVSKPFGAWWDGSGREFFNRKAADIGKGLGTGISGGLLSLLGVDVKSTADEGASLGAAFAKGFSEGFDADAVKNAIGKAVKGMFSSAAKILPGGEKADLSSWLSAALLAKMAGALTGFGRNVFGLGRTIFGGGPGGLGLGRKLIGSTGNQMAQGTGLLNLLANAGYAMTGGSASAGGYFGAGTAMAGSTAAALGAAGIAGGILGGVTLISGAKDMYDASKSEDQRKRNAYTAAGVAKIGAAGAGALAGTMIAPGIGTLIGAGVGGLAGMFMGNREKESYEKELRKEQAALQEEAEAVRKAGLQKEKANYQSEAMRKAFDQTTLSVEAFKKSQEYAALLVGETSQNMKRHFGDVSLSMEEIQNLARRITLGGMETAFDEFAKASDMADSRVAELKDTLSDLNRLEWKAGFGLALTVQERDDYKSKVETYINTAKQYVEDKQYEFTASVSLLMEISEGSKGEGLLNGADAVYGELQELISSYGEQLQETLDLVLADGVVSEHDTVKIQVDGVEVELPENEAVEKLQAKIREITEQISTAQQKAVMETLKIKYGSTQMDSEAFQSLQQELGVQGEQTAKGYQDALQAGLAGLQLQYPDGGAEYDAAAAELSANYQEKMNELTQGMKEFQFDMLAENYAEEFGRAFAGMDLEGADISEKIQTAMKNATADGVDVSSWDADTASKYLGLEGLEAGTVEAITQITSEIAKTLPGNLAEIFAGGTEGTVTEGVFKMPEEILSPFGGYVVDSLASSVAEADFASVGTAIDTGVSSYLSGAGSTMNVSSYAAALNTVMTSGMEGVGSTAGEQVAGNVNTGMEANTSAVEPGCQAVRAAADSYMETYFSSPFQENVQVNITADYHVLNPFQPSALQVPPVLNTGLGAGKRADGGFTNGAELSWIGEDGPEVVIPLGGRRRQRGIDLWQRAGELLGVGKFADGGFAGRMQGRMQNREWMEDAETEESGGMDGSAVPKIPDGGNGIRIEVNMNPSFQITENGGNAADGNGIIDAIRSHLKELADELAGEIAGNLEGVFGNMPGGA